MEGWQDMVPVLMEQFGKLQAEPLPVANATAWRQLRPFFGGISSDMKRAYETHQSAWAAQRAGELSELADCLILAFYAQANPSRNLLKKLLTLLVEVDFGVHCSYAQLQTPLRQHELCCKLILVAIEAMQLWRFDEGDSSIVLSHPLFEGCGGGDGSAAEAELKELHNLITASYRLKNPVVQTR
ncbi:unnamed protein product [Chrysoparadoxa australica]